MKGFYLFLLFFAFSLGASIGRSEHLVARCDESVSQPVQPVDDAQTVADTLKKLAAAKAEEAVRAGKEKARSKLAAAAAAAKAKVAALGAKLKTAAVEKVKAALAKLLRKTPEPTTELAARGLTDDLMLQLFTLLKRTGLINDVMRMSLTDDEVRMATADITVELIKSGVIPYTEVFVALQESGLALDVVKFSLTDADTRAGLVELVLELVPQLVGLCGGFHLENVEWSTFNVTNATAH